MLHRSVNTNLTKTPEKILAYTHFFSTLLAHFQPIGLLVMHLGNRRSYRYWPSVYMPSTLYDFFLVKILYALNDLWFSYLGIFCSMYVMLTVSYLALAQIWITLVYENVKSGLTFHLGIRIFKEQLVFNKIANSVISGRLIPTFLLGGGLVLGQLVIALLKTYKKQPVTILANFIIVTILMIWACQYVIDIGGKLWESSVQIKKYLILRGCKILPSLESRRVLACTEVRIYMRDDFYFKSTTYYSYLELILNYVITFILATAS